MHRHTPVESETENINAANSLTYKSCFFMATQKQRDKVDSNL